jgi:Tol biopolymer transport system component
MNADGTDLRQLTSGGEEVRAASWSPEGEWIAFVRGELLNGEVWLTRPDGSEARQITEGAAAGGVPFWSPDGRRIVFHSGRDGNREIYVVAPDGSGLQALTNAVDGERYRP